MEGTVNDRKPISMLAWVLSCGMAALGFAGCGSDDTTPAESTADAGSEAATLTEAGKAAVCKAEVDASDQALTCLCNACPSQVYDCYLAGSDASTACQTIVGCALASGCTDYLSCATACATVIGQNQAGEAPAINLLNCALSSPCSVPLGEGGTDAATDAVTDQGSSDGATDAAGE
jgi:hypothetical protein